MIAIADVDGHVVKNSAIDSYARQNTTSVYTPTKIFPMLPLELSNYLTSLLPEQERIALIIELEVSNTGETTLIVLYHARVRNHAQLTYNPSRSFF